MYIFTKLIMITHSSLSIYPNQICDKQDARKEFPMLVLIEIIALMAAEKFYMILILIPTSIIAREMLFHQCVMQTNVESCFRDQIPNYSVVRINKLSLVRMEAQTDTGYSIDAKVKRPNVQVASGHAGAARTRTQYLVR
jgi:hypothetical protein